MKLPILALFVILLSATIIYAEQAEETTKTERNNTSKSESASKPNVSVNKRSQVKTLEEFVPSEEVSADKPIAFPVDI